MKKKGIAGCGKHCYKYVANTACWYLNVFVFLVKQLEENLERHDWLLQWGI